MPASFRRKADADTHTATVVYHDNTARYITFGVMDTTDTALFFTDAEGNVTIVPLAAITAACIEPLEEHS